MKNIFFIITIILLTVSCKTSSPINTSSKTTSLFNGKDLSGWEIHGTEKWYVEDGLLICENGPDEAFGYLGTKKQYKNFELTLEFHKTIKSNSGVFVHSKIKDTKIKGWQVEIAVPTHSTGGIHEYERGWLVKPAPAKDKAIKLGEWNQMKIKVKDNKLTTWINGTQMATITDEKLKTNEGVIALQIHKGNVTKVKWRNIQITEL